MADDIIIILIDQNINKLVKRPHRFIQCHDTRNDNAIYINQYLQNRWVSTNVKVFLVNNFLEYFIRVFGNQDFQVD